MNRPACRFRSVPWATRVLWLFLLVTSSVLVILACNCVNSIEPWRRFVPERVYAPLDEQFDCNRVWAGLESMLMDTLKRTSPSTATDSTRSRSDADETAAPFHIVDLHVLFIGDSWAERAGWAASRALELCRRRLPQPLVSSECAINHAVPGEAHDVTTLSLSAFSETPHMRQLLGDRVVERVRFHTHFMRRRFLVQVAETLVGSVYQDPGLTPTLRTPLFPQLARCGTPWRAAPKHLSHQLPLCPCSDTRKHENNVNRTVGLAAVQVFSGIWDTVRPEEAWDLFSFHERRVDWLRRQNDSRPPRTVYPYVTWEENLKRFRAHLATNFTEHLRECVDRLVASGAEMPMPWLLLSVLPPVNCSGPKFYRLPGRRDPSVCHTLLRPVQHAVDEAVKSIFSGPDASRARSTAPEWLKAVDYHHNIYPDACTMKDGVHLDSAKFGFAESPKQHHCSAHADVLFWDSVQHKLVG